MKSELRAEVYKVYQSYLDAFNREDMDGINACIEFPLTHIGNGKITVLDKFPLAPTEMKKAKGWHRSDSFEIDVVAMTETKAHLLCRNVRRLREDGSLIEQVSAFYAFKKTADGWKMFAISDVVNPADQVEANLSIIHKRYLGIRRLESSLDYQMMQEQCSWRVPSKMQ